MPLTRDLLSLQEKVFSHSGLYRIDILYFTFAIPAPDSRMEGFVVNLYDRDEDRC
jgi:hypothetical protein